MMCVGACGFSKYIIDKSSLPPLIHTYYIVNECDIFRTNSTAIHNRQQLTDNAY